MSSEDTFSLLMAFDSDEPAFRRGFEVGRLWTLAEARDYGPHTVHADTAEMVLRIAEANDLHARREVLDDLFVAVYFSESPS